MLRKKILILLGLLLIGCTAQPYQPPQITNIEFTNYTIYLEHGMSEIDYTTIITFGLFEKVVIEDFDPFQIGEQEITLIIFQGNIAQTHIVSVVVREPKME